MEISLSRHTPGPWVAVGAAVTTPDYVTLAATFKDKAFDNAKLMAAAPRMLKALRAVIDWAEANKRDAGTLDISEMRAAVDEAEGCQ